MSARTAYLCCAVLIASASADAESWKVTVADTARIDVNAPATIVRAVILINPTRDTLLLRETLRLPQGWLPIATGGTVVVPPQSRELRLVSFRVPEQAAPGEFDIQYQTCLDETRCVARSGINVRVVPHQKLAVETLRVPRRALIGAVYEATFRVTNLGNTPCMIRVEPRGAAPATIALSATAWLAAPGEARTITAVVAPDRVLPKRGPQVISLVACADNGITAQAAARTDLVPSGNDGVDVYRRVPSTALLRYSGDDGRLRSQLEIRGAGTFDADGNYGVSYRVRGPNAPGGDVFGLRDELQLALSSPAAMLTLGDQTFGKSDLLVRNRLGRGVAVSTNGDRFRVGGYALETRYPALAERQLAAFSEWRASPAWTLRCNALRQERFGSEQDLLAGGADVAIRPWLSADVETALGQSHDADRRLSRAMAAKLRAQTSRLQLSAEVMQADPEFPGRVQGHELLNSSWRLHLNSRLQSFGALRWSWLRPSSHYAPAATVAQNSGRAGFTYHPAARTSLTLDAEQRDYRTTFAELTTETREELITGRCRFGRGFISIEGTAGANRFLGTQSDGGIWHERAGTGITLKPLAGLSLTAKYDLSYTQSYSSQRPTQTYQLGLACQPWRRLSVSIGALRSELGAVFMATQEQLSAEAKWQNPWRHNVSAKFRRLVYRRSAFAGETGVLLSYEIPFTIPLGRKPGLSVVKGRVTDAARAGRGVPNVMVTMDDNSVMTDRHGRFRFTTSQPGAHYVEVDPSALAAQSTVLPMSPLYVKARDRKTEQLAFTVVSGASIEGQVMIYGIANGASEQGLLRVVDAQDSARTAAPTALVPLRGIHGATLELRGEQRSFTLRTNAAGQFALANITPGRWTVHLRTGDIPAHHVAEQLAYDIEVAPGTDARVLVRVLPVSRPILIVDEGKVPKISVTKR